MSLRTDVEARVPTLTLAQLTNGRDNAATTIDDTVMDGVCEDTQGYLETELGVDYLATGLPDRDLRFHKGMATLGVLILLEMYTSTEGARAQARFDNWISRLQARRRRAVLQPNSNALAAVTEDTADDIPVFDPTEDKKVFVAKRSGGPNSTLMLPRTDAGT